VHLPDLLADYSLVEGDLILVEVVATNYFGSSTPSAFGDSVAMQTVPHKPLNPPMRGDLTTTAQLQVLFDFFDESENGGALITSYVVSWDQGIGNWEDIEETTLQSVFEYRVSSG
jgi:hypothetical protein